MSKNHPEPLLAADPATDHVLGPASARVTLIEYGDFACPACKEACGAVKILLRKYGRQLRFVYRHFPEVEIHPHAELAAEASEAVSAQGHFWPFHDLLFEHQENQKDKSLRQYADEVGTDLIRYDHEMRDRIYLQRVQEQSAGARRLGIQSMPTFFVNGQRVDVSFGWEFLDKAIAQAVLA